MSNKVYRVDYEGSWLGGIAVVVAGSEEEAERLVEADPKTVDFKNVEVSLLDGNGVLYNDNGDY